MEREIEANVRAGMSAAEARRMGVLLEAGQTEEAAAIGLELSDTLAPLRPTAGLAL